MVGSSLALVASGLALLFGVLHIINFAQGDFFMLGGYAVCFVLTLTQNYVLAMIVGTLLVAIFGGALLSAICWPLLQKSQVLILLATLGLSLILQQLATNYLGGDTKLVAFPVTTNVQLGPMRVPAVLLLVVIDGHGRAGRRLLCAAVHALRHLAARRGPEPADGRGLGVPVPRVYLLTLAVCSGLAGMAGGLLLPLYSVYPTVGNDVILNAFIVVVAGGLGNFRGAAIISLVVGEVLSIGSLFLTAERAQTGPVCAGDRVAGGTLPQYARSRSFVTTGEKKMRLTRRSLAVLSVHVRTRGRRLYHTRRKPGRATRSGADHGPCRARRAAPAPTTAPAAAAPTGSPIKVGVLDDVTGIGAIEGALMRISIELAVQETNTTGGINGHPLAGRRTPIRRATPPRRCSSPSSSPSRTTSMRSRAASSAPSAWASRAWPRSCSSPTSPSTAARATCSRRSRATSTRSASIPLDVKRAIPRSRTKSRTSARSGRSSTPTTRSANRSSQPVRQRCKRTAPNTWPKSPSRSAKPTSRRS